MTADHDDDRPADGATGRTAVDVGSIAHAINTPLAVALANTTFVLEDLAPRPDPEGALAPLRGALAEALAGLKRIEGAMEELAPRRPLSGRGTVDVRAVVDRAVTVLRSELATATVIRRHEPVPPVRGVHAHHLFVVLTTMLARAGGPASDGARQILVRTSIAGDLVAIDVTTTGLGLALTGGGPAGGPELAELRAFEESLASLRAAGAAVTLDVTEHGSSARIELPAAVTPRPAPLADAPPRRARVVVVDDEELIVKVVQRILAGEHDVVGFVDPEAALEHLLSGPHPDIVLCDLMMPRLSGSELFERACAAHPPLAARFVFLSGGASGARPRAFLAAPTLIQLPKPFSAAALRTLVRERVGKATA